MSKATRYLAGVLALGFSLVGVIVFLRTLTGERMDSYVFPCVLTGVGLLAGGLAWNFGSGVDTDGVCTTEGDDGDKHAVKGDGSDAAA
jgi:hypothetical protein